MSVSLAPRRWSLRKFPVHERIRTLVLHATGVPRLSRVIADTLQYGLRIPLEPLHRFVPRARCLFLLRDEYATLSYVQDWLDALQRHPTLMVTPCNVNNLVALRAARRRIKSYDLVVVLHSVTGDAAAWLRRIDPLLLARRGPLVTFFGNEYTLIPEKVRFARAVEAEFIASQLPPEAAKWLYAGSEASVVIHAPAALNPAIYTPCGQRRRIDVGFRGDLYRDALLGDQERSAFLRHFEQHGKSWGLKTDIVFSRVPREQWSAFLGQSHAVVGAESGTYYLERDDGTQRAVRAYLAEQPEIGFDEIFTRFFAGRPRPVSGKAISSRHFEPMGTMTCQILLEGEYNGILRPDEHYISVRKDLSNLGDAILRFKDYSYRHALVNRSYQYANDAHTYRHRVDALIDAVSARLG